MCGIAGVWRRRGRDAQLTAQRMTLRLAHRGPDDSGVWHDPVTGVALGFRRLAIIDVSPAGHQPMHSASGRYTIVYNGEVYNFASIRAELQESGNAPSWRGHSDTEVMLAPSKAVSTRVRDSSASPLVGQPGTAAPSIRDGWGQAPLLRANGERALFDRAQGDDGG